MIATTLNAREHLNQWLHVYTERLTGEDYVALFLCHQPNGFTFDSVTAKTLSGKPVVVFDMREFGWQDSWKNADVIGWAKERSPLYPEESEYDWMREWIHGQKVALYFKREFSVVLQSMLNEFKGGCPFPVLPIDLISRNRPGFSQVTRELYLQRNGIMHVFGHSHEDRPELLAALRGMAGWHEMIHHTQRRPLNQIILQQGSHLLSTALGGCGHKTFRHSESCCDCVPVLADVGMKFSVPWTDENAVLLPTDGGRLNIEQSVATIKQALEFPEVLWFKYEAAQKAAAELSEDHYVEHHINQHIKAAL